MLIKKASFAYVAVLTTCLWALADAISSSDCTSAKDCSECLRLASCAWCANKEFLDSGTSYCNSREFWNSKEGRELCEGHLIDETGSVKILEDLPLSSTLGSVIQLRPQKIKVRARPGDVANITVSVGHAANYPLDVYVLLDLSDSMKDDKETLSRLGSKLAEALTGLTANYLVGFGSFVDKERGPFVNESWVELDYATSPYSFRHHMSLTRDADKFATSVQQANISISLDTPEGGFDALMQAMVCKDQIGWRNDSRKLIILATDAVYHMAGDGKLAGVVEPNDGQCHLDETGRYRKSTVFDYPSIAQIAHEATENGINIIFAITGPAKARYQDLLPRIKGAEVGELQGDSANIIDLVVEQYKKVISTVELVDTAQERFKVEYYSSCLTGGDPVKTSKCDGLKEGNTVDFTIGIQAKSCQDARNYTETFSVRLIGLRDTLTVEVDVVCDCECDASEDIDLFKCYNNGTLHCGRCKCPAGYSGRKCECDSESAAAQNQDRCRKDNSTEICSGRGNCLCGSCVCEETGHPEQVISGEYCECTNFSCPQSGGLICSDHGTCNCDGTCSCHPGWQGKACDCSTNRDTCKNPADGSECSGKGSCVCGKCICDGTSVTGRYCEECPTCKARCGGYKDCVLCKAYNEGPYANNSCAECADMTVTLVDVAEETSTQEIKCTFYDEDQRCQFSFIYNVDIENYVRAEREKQCAAEANPIVISVALVASIVVAGLLALLIWKLATWLHDRREYALFEQETKKAKWDGGNNPLYKEATTVYRNPAYPH